MPWHPPCALISLITKTNVQVLLFLPSPALQRQGSQALDWLLLETNQAFSISISRFLFAFFSMRFSRYVFALYCFAIHCSGRLILRKARPPGRFRSLLTLFGNAVRECSSEPSKRYMRESFTRPRVVQTGISIAMLFASTLGQLLRADRPRMFVSVFFNSHMSP